EKRESHISFIVVFEAPSKIDINNITASATHATINFVVKVCLRIIDIMGGYLSNPSKKGGSTADSLPFFYLIKIIFIKNVQLIIKCSNISKIKAIYTDL